MQIDLQLYRLVVALFFLRFWRRVLRFVLILGAIVDKNVSGRARKR